MSVASNQYAAKLFSEHPVAIWPLDDRAYFLSVISDTQKNISGASWTKDKCSVSLISNPSLLPSQRSPFLGTSAYYEVSGDHTLITSPNTKIEVLLSNAIQSQSLNEDLKTFFMNLYVFQQSNFAESYEFGYRYFDTVAGVNIERTKTVQASEFQEWINLSETFDVTEFDTDQISFFIRFYVSPGGTSGQYKFIVHGLSIGQWSELFSSEDTGVYPQTLPSSVGLGSLPAIAGDQYGPLSDNAYYICENSKLLAQNEGVPIVFGSKSATRLYPGSNQKPSLVFPGKGMFSEKNKYQSMSLEFWMRIKPNTNTPKKIFGPINSAYGLYVSEGFMTLSVGGQVKGFNVSEWYRPMLIHLIYTQNSVSLLVNSEKTIEIEIDTDTFNYIENEWFGFYSYEEIDIFEIDCVSILPYVVPLPVAKRRFVWGQGVESENLIDSSFKGTTAAVSFPNALYSSNMIYPDKERWDAGYYNNLRANTKFLSVPEYSLPNIFLSNRNISNWYSENKTVNDIDSPSGNDPKFITFRPNTNSSQTTWIRSATGNWNEKCYLNFSSSNVTSSPFNTIYGVFGVEDNISSSRPLIHIVNTLTNKRFEINIQNNSVIYRFDDTTIKTINISGSNDIVVGIHVPYLSEQFGTSISSFFASYDSLQIFIGGAPDTDVAYQTFEGKIYKFGVDNDTSFENIEDEFSFDGFAVFDSFTEFINHSSMYSVSPFDQYGMFFLDISVYSVWEEYYPLSYFAQYVEGFKNKQYYDVDFLQFNFGYPSYAEKINTATQNNPWANYAALDYAFAYPTQQLYEDLDNINISGFETYEDLDLNRTVQNLLDLSESSVRVFATFQLLAEGSDEPLSSFTFTSPLSQNKVVDASLQNVVADPYRAYKTKFAITDGTIIYPPKNISIENVSLNLHFIIDKKAILSNPLIIRDMEISSKALSRVSRNPIGTKFENQIIPYTRSGIYYSYKSKNPYSIFKKSMPYLYLTENSGIKILEFSDNLKEYGAQIRINQQQEENFFLGATQIFIKYDIEDIPSAPVPLFEVQYKGGTVEFLSERDSSGLRSKIFARDKNTKSIFNNVSFYQNGINVKNPYIVYGQWNVLGIVFEIPLDFRNYSGSINIFAGCTFNNISAYRSDGLNEISSVIARIWQNVLSDGPTNYDWRYWYDQNETSDVQTWRNVYELASNQYYSLSAKDIFEAYSGTNINVFDDNTGISVENDVSVVISGVSWSTITEKPV